MSPWKTLGRWLRGLTPRLCPVCLRLRRLRRTRPALEWLEDRLVPTANLTDFRPIIGLDAVEAQYAYRGDNYSVAILDTGVNYNLPDLGGGWGKRVVAGYNFINNTSDPMDDNGHGTFVAGEIGSSSTQYPGIAPDVNIVALKVLDKNNAGTWTNIDLGLQWVINHQTQYHIVAVNLSLGSANYTTNPYDLLEKDFTTLKSQGVFISIASGNYFATFNSQPGLAYPAVSSNVVSVGATWAGSYGSVTFNGATDTSTSVDQITGFTQRDSALSLLAPGAWLTSDSTAGGYMQFGGTSMAAAVVTGASVIIHQAMDADGLAVNANQDYILNLMQSTGAVIKDNNPNTNVVPTGLTFRRLDLRAALAALPPPATVTPIPDQTIAPGGSVVVPVSATNFPGGPASFSAAIVDAPALAWQVNHQLGLTTTGSYYLNQRGYNEKWLLDRNRNWYFILPDGEFRRFAGTMPASMTHANLVAMFDPSYYADPRLLWYAPYVAFPPVNLSISGNQLTVQSTSPTWTGSVVVDVTATDGSLYVDKTFTVNVQGSAPVIASIANRTIPHSQHQLVVAVSARDPQGRPLTYSAQVLPVNGQTPAVSIAFQGNQLTVSPALSFVGTCTIRVTVSDGIASATTSFNFTVTNSAPQFAAIAEQSMSAGQTSMTLPLSASDAEGDALTFSAQALVPDAQAYQLEQQLGLRQYAGSYYTNLWGLNERWLIGANNLWYCLLPTGQLYRWAGSLAQTLQTANLVASLDPIFWTEPRLLLNAPPPVSPAITFAVQGNQLTIQRPGTLTGVFRIVATASDGAANATTSFLLVLN